tara:strand:- start:314 stop:508 length:195 start_codon:yes stop_codon:yes gene_type:complete
MKVKKKDLEQIIEEELRNVLLEGPHGDRGQFQAIKATMLDEIKDPQTKKVFQMLLDLLSGAYKV